MGGAYVNFMMEEGQERIQATYGENHERLSAIKKKIRSGQSVSSEPKH